MGGYSKIQGANARPMIYDGENDLGKQGRGEGEKGPQRLLKYLSMGGHSGPENQAISDDGVFLYSLTENPEYREIRPSCIFSINLKTGNQGNPEIGTSRPPQTRRIT